MYANKLELNTVPVASSIVSLNGLIDTHVKDNEIVINEERYSLAEVIVQAQEKIKKSYGIHGIASQLTGQGHFLVPNETHQSGIVEVSSYPQHDRLAYIKKDMKFPNKSTEFVFIEGVGYPLYASQGRDGFDHNTGHHWSLGLASKSMEHWYLLNLALYGISNIIEMDQPPVPIPLQLLQLEQVVTTEGMMDAQELEKLPYQLVFASKGGLRYGDALYSMTDSGPQSMERFKGEYPNIDLMKQAARSLGLFLKLGQILALEYYKEGMVCFDNHNFGPYEIFGLTRYPTPFIGNGSTPSIEYGKGTNSSAAEFVKQKLQELELRFGDNGFSLIKDILEVQGRDSSKLVSMEQAMKLAINPDPNYWPEDTFKSRKRRRWFF